MAIDRMNKFEKENYIAHSSEVVLPPPTHNYMARLSPVRRHSPAKEYVIARRSVSPHRNLGSSPLTTSL